MKKYLAMVIVYLCMAGRAAAQLPQSGFTPSSLPTDSGSLDAPPEISPHAEQWRYSFQNGFCWYFTPERRWLYWSQGRWVEYLPPGRSNTPPYVQPPTPARWRPFGTIRRRSPVSVPNGSGAPLFGYPSYRVY